MDLATIEMPRAEAREAFLTYRRAVRERHNAEDQQIMRGYRELARGRQLIRLSETIAAGGTTTLEHRRQVWDQSNRRVWQTDHWIVPRLAVARAHVKEAWTFGIRPDGSCELRSKKSVHTTNRRDVHAFGEGTFGRDETRRDPWSWEPRIKALVPIVPPPLRPADSLSNYMILWEADWTVEAPPIPPGDPALLKRIGGDLYAVVAVWDLTEVERAVLALRA